MTTSHTWEERLREEWKKFCDRDSTEVGGVKISHITMNDLADWWIEHMDEVEQEAFTRGKEEAVRKIRERVEGIRKPIKHDDECLAITENEKYCDCGLKTYLEGFDRALCDVLDAINLNKETQ